MVRVLGIDVASSNWAANGSALLTFEIGAPRFSSAVVPAIKWPDTRLSPESLAGAIDDFVRSNGIVAVALDGPQGWRDPQTPAGEPGVGRRCEHECRTQAKTGVRPQTYPGSQRRWVEFCVELFSLLLQKPGAFLGGNSRTGQSDGYAVLECYPTLTWKAAGLPPLPSKSRTTYLTPYARRLFGVFGIPPVHVSGHDDLQAVVAAISAAGYIGGPVIPESWGAPAFTRRVDQDEVRLEGVIWAGRPSDPSSSTIEAGQLESGQLLLASVERSEAARVTQAVVDHVTRAGRGQAQIALRGCPQGTRLNRLYGRLDSDDDSYPIVIADSHAAWARHQTGDASDGFDRLFGRLSEQANEWLPVSWHPAPEPTRASPQDHLASQGPPVPDFASRTVAITVSVENGKLVEFGTGTFPLLGDCIGELSVPAFAVLSIMDRERLTQAHERQLLDADTLLLCRVSGPQVPAELLPACRKEPVPDSGVQGAFVEILLQEPLFVVSRGTKKAALRPVRCVIPALSGVEVKSLNEAYRRISERFEPKRRSVGGNVFRSVYYFEPSLNQWRPIGELRGDIVFESR